MALDEAITRAEQEERHSNSALLTLVKAAISNDPSLICKCLGEPDGAYNDEGGPFSLLRSSLQRGEVSAVLPLRVAQRYAHSIVVGEILARTGTNKQRGVVDWREMELFQLDEYSLHKVRWVRMLNIAHCRVESLPQEVGCYLKQVGIIGVGFHWEVIRCVCVRARVCLMCAYLELCTTLHSSSAVCIHKPLQSHLSCYVLYAQ